MKANCGDHDHTPCFVASDLGLHKIAYFPQKEAMIYTCILVNAVTPKPSLPALKSMQTLQNVIYQLCFLLPFYKAAPNLIVY